MALTIVVLPPLSYLAIHWAVLNHWLHFWSLLLLFCGPLALLCVLPGGLWWLPGSLRVVTALKRVLLLVSALGVLAGAGHSASAAAARQRASWNRAEPALLRLKGGKRDAASAQKGR
jgi:hypothetical protein